MIELCREYLFVRWIWLYVIIMSRCIWLYVIVMSRTSFRVNPYTTFWLNVMELLARSRHRIWSLNVSNKIRTLNKFVRKRTLNHLAKLGKSLSWVVRTYLEGACHYHVNYEFRSQSRLYCLSESEGIPCSNLASFLKFKWQQQDSNPKGLST